jgi:hypothetical protein
MIDEKRAQLADDRDALDSISIGDDVAFATDKTKDYSIL